jgi:IPT/TIG domain
VHRGSVYTENRAVVASHGSFRDRFAQWDVHVYHFVEPLLVRKLAPTKGTVGTRVTLQGKGLAAATRVSFGRAKARFRIVNDRKLVATVPKRAKSGPVVVTSALTQVKSRDSFRVLRSG